MASTDTIRSDADAWRYLNAWVERGVAPAVSFDGWPVLTIKVKGDDYSSSLNSKQMSALVDFKMTLGRAYAVLSHGAYDMRRLTEEEEERIDFSTRVEQGSSISDTDLSPIVKAFASIITSHPGSSVVAAVVLGLAFVSKALITGYYENKAKKIDADERRDLVKLALSAQEKAQLELYDRTVLKLQSQHPQLAQALPDARQGFWKFASATLDADEMEIAGLAFTQQDLEILASRSGRRSSEQDETSGVFVVRGISTYSHGYIVKLESKSLVIGARYTRPQLTQGRLRALMKCLSDNQPIYATLLVKTVDKAQMGGRLIKFRPFNAIEG